MNDTKDTGRKARINVDVPADLHRRVRIHAVTEGVTMGDLVIRALERLLADEHSRRS